MVYVEKGGEIIPKITGVDKDARSFMLGEKVRFIVNCPECGSKLVGMKGKPLIIALMKQRVLLKSKAKSSILLVERL